MTDELVAKAKWPPEWFGLSSWLFVDNPVNLRHKDGRMMHMIGGVLKNGTNLVALVWDGGQNIARVDSENDWMIEERVDPRAPKAARQAWRQLIEGFVAANREVPNLTEEEQRELTAETLRTVTWVDSDA